jgi:hypothetical protein
MATMTRGWGMVLGALVIVLGLLALRPATMAHQTSSQGGTAATKYTVVDSEGTNLTVVDNTTNMLYFYCAGQDKAVGDPLQLRGTIDLSEVGKQVLTPKKGDSER